MAEVKPKLIYFNKSLPLFFIIVKQSKNWEVIGQAFFSLSFFHSFIWNVEKISRFKISFYTDCNVA